MKKEYINTGKCIWCGREKPAVSFHTAPHIVPKCLGGVEIGTDICDDCNHAFGTAVQGSPSVDAMFREVFEAYRFFLQLRTNEIKDSRRYRSCLFSYFRKTGTFKINNSYSLAALTRQFKRSVFEVFLQKYHQKTGDGNNAKFEAVRNFARYNIRDLKLYYTFNNVLLTENTPIGFDENVSFFMSPNMIDTMEKTGYFSLYLFGHNFYLEVLPVTASLFGDKYLRKEAGTVLLRAKGNESIRLVTSLRDIDIFLDRFVE